MSSLSCFLGKVNFSTWIVLRKTTTGSRLLHIQIKKYLLSTALYSCLFKIIDGLFSSYV